MELVRLEIPYVLKFLEQLYKQQHPEHDWHVIYVVNELFYEESENNKFLVFKSLADACRQISLDPHITHVWAGTIQEGIDEGYYTEEIMSRPETNRLSGSEREDYILTEVIKKELIINNTIINLRDVDVNTAELIFSSIDKAKPFYQCITQYVMDLTPQFAGDIIVPRRLQELVKKFVPPRWLELSPDYVVQLLEKIYKLQNPTETFYIVYITSFVRINDYLPYIDIDRYQFLVFKSPEYICSKLAKTIADNINRLVKFVPSRSIGNHVMDYNMISNTMIINYNHNNRSYNDDNWPFITTANVSIRLTFSSSDLANKFKQCLDPLIMDS